MGGGECWHCQNQSKDPKLAYFGLISTRHLLLSKWTGRHTKCIVINNGFSWTKGIYESHLFQEIRSQVHGTRINWSQHITENLRICRKQLETQDWMDGWMNGWRPLWPATPFLETTNHVISLMVVWIIMHVPLLCLVSSYKQYKPFKMTVVFCF